MSQLGRLYAAIKGTLPQNEAGLTQILKLFLALSFEFRAGTISREDLADRVTGLVAAMRAYRSKETTQKDAIDYANEKYPTVDLRDELFSNTTLVAMLADGRIDNDAILADVLRSEHFQDVKTQDAWKTVWWGLKQEPIDFDQAVETMNAKFEAREYLQPDEFLHVAMLQLWLCTIGVDVTPLKTKIEAIKQAIDDISATERWPKQSPGRPYRVGMEGAHGHSFQLSETDAFKEVKGHLQTALDRSFKTSMTAWASELLDLMETNVSTFVARVCWTNYSGADFILEPVFAEITPREFVDRLLKRPVAVQDMVLQALKERYARGDLDSRFPQEKAWFKGVRKLLKAERSKRTGIQLAQLEAFDRWYFEPILDGPT